MWGWACFLETDCSYPATEDRVFKVMACDHTGEKTNFSTPCEDEDYNLLTNCRRVCCRCLPVLQRTSIPDQAEQRNRGVQVHQVDVTCSHGNGRTEERL